MGLFKKFKKSLPFFILLISYLSTVSAFRHNEPRQLLRQNQDSPSEFLTPPKPPQLQKNPLYRLRVRTANGKSLMDLKTSTPAPIPLSTTPESPGFFARLFGWTNAVSPSTPIPTTTTPQPQPQPQPQIQTNNYQTRTYQDDGSQQSGQQYNTYDARKPLPYKAYLYQELPQPPLPPTGQSYSPANTKSNCNDCNSVPWIPIKKEKVYNNQNNPSLTNNGLSQNSNNKKPINQQNTSASNKVNVYASTNAAQLKNQTNTNCENNNKISRKPDYPLPMKIPIQEVHMFAGALPPIYQETKFHDFRPKSDQSFQPTTRENTVNSLYPINGSHITTSDRRHQVDPQQNTTNDSINEASGVPLTTVLPYFGIERNNVTASSIETTDSKVSSSDFHPQVINNQHKTVTYIYLSSTESVPYTQNSPTINSLTGENFKIVNPPNLNNSTTQTPIQSTSTTQQPTIQPTRTVRQPTIQSTTVQQPAIQTTTVQQPKIQSTTTVQQPITQSTIIVQQPTTQSTIVQQPITQSTTTVQQPIIQTTTTVQQPIIQSTSTVQQLTTQSTTVQQQPIIQTTTTIEQPIIQTTTTVQQPIIQSTTTVRQPTYYQVQTTPSTTTTTTTQQPYSTMNSSNGQNKNIPVTEQPLRDAIYESYLEFLKGIDNSTTKEKQKSLFSNNNGDSTSKLINDFTDKIHIPHDSYSIDDGDTHSTSRRQIPKRNKLFQIIIPYTSQYKPSPFQLPYNSLNQQDSHSDATLVSPTISTSSKEFNTNYQNQVSKNLEKLLNLTAKFKKSANTSIDHVKLQKNIDNWTILEYSTTKLPGSLSPQLTRSKSIPDEYLTTTEPSTTENSYDDENDFSEFFENDLEHVGSSSVKNIKYSPFESEKTRSQLIKTSEESSINMNDQSSKQLSVSMASLNNERVYVVTPQTFTSHSNSNNNNKSDNKNNRSGIRKIIKSNTINSTELNSIEKAYQVLPEAVNNLEVASTGPAQTGLWGIMEHDQYASVLNNSTSKIPVLHSGHSKVSHGGQ